MDLQQPSLRKFAPAHRADLERIFDLANTLRTDETVERVVDTWARRYELLPSPGQKLMMAMPAQTLAAQFRALFREDGGGKDSWFDADSVTSDGGSKLYSWNDRIDATHLLFQATSGGQCNLPTADASFANAKTATFNGTSNVYVTTRAAAAFTFIHNGAGSEVIGVFWPNTPSTNVVLWSTYKSGAPSVRHYTDLGYWALRVQGGGDALINAGAGSLPYNTALYDVFSLSSADAPQMRGYHKSTQIGSVASVGTPGTAPPDDLFTFGNLFPGATNWFTGRVRALYLFRRVLSAAEKTTYRSYIQADTGIAP